MLAGIMLHRAIRFMQNGALQCVALGPSGEAQKVVLNHVRSSLPVQMCSVRTQGKGGAWAPDKLLVYRKHLNIQVLLREGNSNEKVIVLCLFQR